MTEDRDDRESTPTYDDLPEAVLDFAEENGFSPKLVAFVGEWHDHEVFDCADDPWFLEEDADAEDDDDFPSFIMWDGDEARFADEDEAWDILDTCVPSIRIPQFRQQKGPLGWGFLTLLKMGGAEAPGLIFLGEGRSPSPSRFRAAASRPNRPVGASRRYACAVQR